MLFQFVMLRVANSYNVAEGFECLGTTRFLSISERFSQEKKSNFIFETIQKKKKKKIKHNFYQTYTDQKQVFLKLYFLLSAC